jgi:hypothetical protein
MSLPEKSSFVSSESRKKGRTSCVNRDTANARKNTAKASRELPTSQKLRLPEQRDIARTGELEEAGTYSGLTVRDGAPAGRAASAGTWRR